MASDANPSIVEVVSMFSEELAREGEKHYVWNDRTVGTSSWPNWIMRMESMQHYSTGTLWYEVIIGHGKILIKPSPYKPEMIDITEALITVLQKELFGG